ncbi:MAG: 30S ribosomal protein S13 [Candidatus Aenigmarchaeota archaeon]|nr:30S ribosomal protein S13 [Candidatus Aenigmarchaeota archaeon]
MGSDAELRRLEKKIQKKEMERAGGAKPAEKEKEKKPAHKPAEGPRAKVIIRVADTNLDADRKVRRAIMEVKGVGPMFANAVANACGFGDKPVKELSEAEIKKLEDIMANPGSYGIPAWVMNRRSDPQTGENRHLIVSNLDFARTMDINEMKKWKTYKGVRHAAGLPVRGQRTRSSFRGKGTTVGVQRKKEQPAKAGEKKEEKK